MRVTRHASSRARSRAGIDLGKAVWLMQQQGLHLGDGEHRTEFGTLIIRQGVVVTFLEPEMAVVRRSSRG